MKATVLPKECICPLFVDDMLFVEIYGGLRLNAQHFTSRNTVIWYDKESDYQHYDDVILTEEEYTTPSYVEYEMLKTCVQQIRDHYHHSVMIGIGVAAPKSISINKRPVEPI